MRWGDAQRDACVTATSVRGYGRRVGLLDALAVDHQGLRVVPGPLSQQRIANALGRPSP